MTPNVLTETRCYYKQHKLYSTEYFNGYFARRGRMSLARYRGFPTRGPVQQWPMGYCLAVLFRKEVHGPVFGANIVLSYWRNCQIKSHEPPLRKSLCCSFFAKSLIKNYCWQDNSLQFQLSKNTKLWFLLLLFIQNVVVMLVGMCSYLIGKHAASLLYTHNIQDFHLVIYFFIEVIPYYYWLSECECEPLWSCCMSMLALGSASQLEGFQRAIYP